MEYKEKAVALVRTAATSQKADNTALKNQKNRIRKYAEANNIEIVRWVDTSHNKYDFLNTYIACSENEETRKLLVTDISRFTRSIEEFVLWKRELRELSIEIVSVNNTSTDMAANEMLQKFMVAMAEYQRFEQSERVKRALRNKKLNQKAQA